MAKRRPPSQANDTFAAAAAPKPKARSTSAPRRSMAVATDPSEADIRYRAYLRYLERGGDEGSEFDDWLYAERELKKA